jgi:TPP-dependent pyruvate/acetoin dehydrogenase alpha subunit
VTLEGMPDIWAAYMETFRIRRFELEIANRYHPSDGDAPMRCPTHLSVGQEHVAVAVARAVPAGSHAYSTHRAHSHYLSWGGDETAFVAELYGRVTGCARGWGGSMHLIDEAVGFMGTSAIVGSSVSLAVGDALARQLTNEPEYDAGVTVAFAGDAVPETGQFWEALNFAALKQLRLLIVIENNGLATSTILDDRQSYHYGPMAALHESGFSRYSFLDFPTYSEIADEVTRLIANNVWPIVISADVDRFAEHVGPVLNDRVGESGDELVAMRKAAIDSMGDPPDILEVLELAEAKRIGEIFESMNNLEAHPWPTAP